MSVMVAGQGSRFPSAWSRGPKCLGTRLVFTYPDIADYFVSGYAWAEDKEHCEEYGRMIQADPDKVSPRAKKRGLPQVNEPSS